MGDLAEGPGKGLGVSVERTIGRQPCKIILRIVRNIWRNIVISAKKMLDKSQKGWYHNQARVGENCACTAMMREIASQTVTSAEYVRSSGG